MHASTRPCGRQAGLCAVACSVLPPKCVARTTSTRAASASNRCLAAMSSGVPAPLCSWTAGLRKLRSSAAAFCSLGANSRVPRPRCTPPAAPAPLSRTVEPAAHVVARLVAGAQRSSAHLAAGVARLVHEAWVHHTSWQERFCAFWGLGLGELMKENCARSLLAPAYGHDCRSRDAVVRPAAWQGWRGCVCGCARDGAAAPLTSAATVFERSTLAISP